VVFSLLHRRTPAPESNTKTESLPAHA
jgi:hypothetical protein